MARQQHLFLQRLLAGGVPFCNSSVAQKFVGNSASEDFHPTLGGIKKEPIQTRICVGTGQSCSQAVPVQHAVAQADR